MHPYRTPVSARDERFWEIADLVNKAEMYVSRAMPGATYHESAPVIVAVFEALVRAARENP